MYDKTIVVGTLGRDPEMRYLSNGDAVTNLNVAASRGKDRDGNWRPSVWFRVSVFGKQAENANQYLKKGAKVLVEGVLKCNEYGNPNTYTRQDGTVSASFELTAYNITYLSRSDEGNSNYSDNEPVVTVEEDDEIPF